MYKYTVLLLVLCVGCTSQNKQAGQKASIRYFSKMTGIISPYMEYSPRGELDSIEIIGKSYYSVMYYTQDDIAEIRYFKNGKKSEDSYFGTHKVVYQYYQDSILRRYYNSDNKKAYMSRHYYGGGDIYKERFSLNKGGIKQEMTMHDTLNKRVSNAFGTYKYIWKTNTANKFIQHQYKQDGSYSKLTSYFPFYSAEITIDSKGHLYSITNLDTITMTKSLQKQAGYATVIFDFDDFGNERGWSFHTLDKRLVNRKSVADMEFGYAKVVYDFDWKDQKLGISRSFTMKFLDTLDEPTISNDNIHSSKFEFDDHDNLVSISYFDEQNQPKLHPVTHYHKVELIYDDSGKQTGIIRLDENKEEI